MTVPSLFHPFVLFGGFGVGQAVSIVIVFGGLLWLLIRAIQGKEVERRVIFLFIFVAVSAPILFPLTFTEKATPVVKSVFDKVESLPEGSRVLISFDFDPAMAPEVQPMANAFTRHCLARNLKVIFMSLWATGQSQLNNTLRDVLQADFPDKVDGKDYVDLGYKAGNEGVLNVIITNFKKMFPTDVNGVPYDSVEVLNGITSAKDVSMVFSIGGGKPGVKEWVLFVGDPGDVPTAGGVAAVVAPQLYPYYPKQLLGILGGIKGAAEYESELMRVYPQYKNMATPGLKMMGPQTMAHVVIMAFIIIGNVLYFRHQRVRGK